MKKMLLFVLLCAPLLASAQNKTVTGTDNRIYLLKDVSPQPELAKNGPFDTFFKKEFKAVIADGKSFELTFVIEKNGGPALQLRAASTMSNAVLEEAARVIKAAGKWNPGQKDGKNVRVMYRYSYQASKK